MRKYALMTKVLFAGGTLVGIGLVFLLVIGFLAFREMGRSDGPTEKTLIPVSGNFEKNEIFEPQILEANGFQVEIYKKDVKSLGLKVKLRDQEPIMFYYDVNGDSVPLKNLKFPNTYQFRLLELNSSTQEEGWPLLVIEGERSLSKNSGKIQEWIACDVRGGSLNEIVSVITNRENPKDKKQFLRGQVFIEEERALESGWEIERIIYAYESDTNNGKVYPLRRKNQSGSNELTKLAQIYGDEISHSRAKTYR